MKKLKPLRWWLQVDKLFKTGLLIALFLFASNGLQCQVYFNKLYNVGVGTYSVLNVSEGYFLPTQIQPGNTVGIATMQTDFLGTITGGDTTLVSGYGLFPRLAGSSTFVNNNFYFLGGLQPSPTEGLGVLFSYVNNSNIELARFNFQDTVATNFRSMSAATNPVFTITGYTFKYTGGNPDYQRQLLLMQLDSLGSKLWERSYPAKAGLWHLEGNTVISTKDGGFAVGGNAYNYAVFPSYTSYVLLTDTLGNQLNERYLKFENYGNYSMGLAELPNGNFLVAYATTYKSFPASEDLSRKLMVLELDKNDLSTIWQKEYLQGYLNGLVVSRLIPHNDSTYLIAGTYNPDPILYQGDYASQLGYIFAINSQGDSLWYRDYSNQTDSFEYNYLNDIAVTPDGGIVGGGRLETPNSPYTGGLANHVWLFKTDSIGCLYAGCDTVYAKPKAPITKFKVYPNPLQNGQNLIIELPNATSAIAVLYNAIGQMVFKSELEFDGGRAILSPPQAEGGAGLYILHLQTSNGKNYVEKIVFQ